GYQKWIVIDNVAPTFTMQYYSDAALTTSMGNNPFIKAGTYYIKITSNETLPVTLTASFDAEGTANDITDDSTVVFGTPSNNDFKYKRVIAYDAAAIGSVLENISITGTDTAGNTALNVNPTNEATKVAFTDTVLPTFTTSYYSDAGLTLAMGSNPSLSSGTYYIKLTASEPLQAVPTVSIGAEGVANDKTNDPAAGLFGLPTAFFKYTRMVNNDAAAIGVTLEDISITGTDRAGNTANNADPTDEAANAAYTDTVKPTITTFDCANLINVVPDDFLLSTMNADFSWSGADTSLKQMTYRVTYTGPVGDTPGNSPTTWGSDTTWTKTWASFLDGTYTFTLKITDAAGNSLTQNKTIKCDKTKPSVPVLENYAYNAYSGFSKDVKPVFGQIAVISNTAPLASTKVTASDPTAGSVTSGIGKYRVKAAVVLADFSTDTSVTGYDSGDISSNLTVMPSVTSTYTFAHNDEVKWMVRVYDNVGNFQDSLIKAFRIDTLAPNSCGVAYPADTKWIKTNTPNLQWTAATDNGPAGAGHYVFYIDDNSDFSSPIIAPFEKVPPENYTLLAANFPANTYEGKWLYWKVRLYDKALNYADFATASSSFRFDLTPPKVTLNNPTGGGTNELQLGTPDAGAVKSFWVNSTKPTIKWQDQIDSPSPLPVGGVASGWQAPNKFLVEVSATSFGGTVYSFAGADSVTTPNSHTLGTALSENTPYFFRVRHFDKGGEADAADGNSNSGPIWSFHLDVTKPNPAANIWPGNTVVDVDTNWINTKKPVFKWKDGADAGVGTKEVVVELATNPAFGAGDIIYTKTIAGALVAQYNSAADGSFPALNESVMYYWRVGVRDHFYPSNPQSDWSQAFKFKIDTTKPDVPVTVSPGNFAADGTTGDTTQISFYVNTKWPKFTWNAASDALSNGGASGIHHLKIEISQWNNPAGGKPFSGNLLALPAVMSNISATATEYQMNKTDMPAGLPASGLLFWRLTAYDNTGAPVATDNYQYSQVFAFGMDFAPPDYFSISSDYSDNTILNTRTLSLYPVGPNKETANARDTIEDIIMDIDNPTIAVSGIDRIEYFCKKTSEGETAWQKIAETNVPPYKMDVILPDDGVFDIGAKVYDKAQNVRTWDFANPSNQDEYSVGLLGEYYSLYNYNDTVTPPAVAFNIDTASNVNTEEIRLKRIDQTVNFNWGGADSPTKSGVSGNYIVDQDKF
ncbi:MAG TPA: hypothetical protein PKK26_14485, partial [Candidatus Wallbacteria bacterium]|nr:hypothetical protein [Candidatus Wallbacteria bacterium]